MTSIDVARNVSQKIQEHSIKGNRNTIGTTVIVLFTVAAGKKVIIKSAAQRFVSGGANTFLQILIGGERVSRETAAPVPPVLQDIPTAAGKQLNAGDTIVLSGDSGSNNGSMNFFITFVELPAWQKIL